MDGYSKLNITSVQISVNNRQSLVASLGPNVSAPVNVT